MNKAEVTHQLVDMTTKAAPPIAVTGLSVCGVALPDVVAVLITINEQEGGATWHYKI